MHTTLVPHPTLDFKIISPPIFWHIFFQIVKPSPHPVLLIKKSLEDFPKSLKSEAWSFLEIPMPVS